MSKISNSRLVDLLEKVELNSQGTEILAEIYKRHGKYSPADLVDELRKDASDTIGGRVSGFVDYDEVVKRVALKIGVDKKELANDEIQNELLIIKKMLQDYIKKNPQAEANLENIANELGIEGKEFLNTLFKGSASAFLLMAQSVGPSVVSRTVTLILFQFVSVQSALTVARLATLAVPFLNIVMGAWLLASITGPAYRKITPSVLNIAMLRIMILGDTQASSEGTLAKPEINILLLGKSGAGKSSLANYLYEAELFKTGSGRPVTVYKEPKKASIDNETYILNVYDAPGLEPEKPTEWWQVIREFAEKRNNSSSLSGLLHGIFYVVNAASGRVEQRELDIIKEVSNSFLAPVTVVLTKCDIKSNQHMWDDIKKDIYNENEKICIHQVCSVTEKKRSGEHVTAYGRRELLRSHADHVGRYLELRFGVELFKKTLPQLLDAAIDNIISQLKAADIGVIKFLNNPEILDTAIPLDDLESLPEIQKFKQQGEHFDIYFNAFGSGERISDSIDAMLGDFDTKFIEMFPELADLKRQLESEDWWDNVGGLIKGGYMLMKIETTIINFLETARSKISEELAKKASEYEQELKAGNY